MLYHIGGNMKKSILRLLCLFMLFLIALSIFSTNKINTLAGSSSNEGINGTVMTLEADAIARREASENSEAVASFSAGDSIFVVSEENGWYKIYYKGDYAYVQASNDSNVATVAMSSSAELDKEFNQKEQIDITYVESYLKQQKRARSALVWKIIICVLVVGIIATSVVIGISNAKGKKDGDVRVDNKES